MLNTTLYAIDGKVTIYDIKELVEQYMRDKKIAYLEFGVEVYNEGGEVVIITAFKVLFCSFKPTLSATTYTRLNFLTSQRAKLLDFVTKNGSASSKVLITDYTYEVADDDTEKYIAKFTWKYADNRMTFERPYEVNSRTFTKHFDKTFK